MVLTFRNETCFVKTEQLNYKIFSVDIEELKQNIFGVNDIPKYSKQPANKVNTLNICLNMIRLGYSMCGLMVGDANFRYQHGLNNNSLFNEKTAW